MELIDIIPEFNLYEEFWKIYTKSDILPPQYLADNSKVFRSIVGEGTQVYGEVYNSVIGSGVTIEEGAIVRDSIIMQNARIGAGAVIDKSIIAESTEIGDNRREFIYSAKSADRQEHCYLRSDRAFRL